MAEGDTAVTLLASTLELAQTCAKTTSCILFYFIDFNGLLQNSIG